MNGVMKRMGAARLTDWVAFLLENRPEKAPFIVDDVARFLGMFERRQVLRVLGRFGSVFLVQRQIWKCEHCQRNIDPAFPVTFKKVSDLF